MKLLTVVQQLTKARDQARREYERLNSAVSALNGSNSHGRRILSKDARERIAEAQRKRWAKTRTAKGQASKGQAVTKSKLRSAQHSYWARMSKAERRAEMKRRGMLRTK